MFEDLREKWITDAYLDYKAILVPSISKQLSTVGWILDLNSLPTKPFPFKELFIRWLISVNKLRIEKQQPIIITISIIKMCPIWNIVKCPLKKIKLTKEEMFNKPKSSVSTIGTKSSTRSINTKTTNKTINPKR
jgi:hypothetical protein